MAAKGKSLPFVLINENDQFSIGEEAMDLFQKYSDKSISIITVGGPWRTGKSFLANRILGTMNAFKLGGTVKACTKGVWVWSEPIQLSQSNYAFVMDAEGLNSTERTTETDNKLFAICLLLSSMFVYNCRGHITEQALEDLSVIINLTQYISINHNKADDNNDLFKFFPSFFWVLRDFSLNLQGKSPKDYLEDCLRPQVNTGEEGSRKNLIRSNFINYFRNRDCCTLVRPINDESKIVHMDDMQYTELRLEFTKIMDNLTIRILSKTPVKTINGIPINGQLMVGLALEYVDAINSNDTPTIMPIFERVLIAQGRKTQEEEFEKFKLKISEAIPEASMPFDEDIVNENIMLHSRASIKSLMSYLADTLSSNDLSDIINKHQKQIDTYVESLCILNKQKSTSYCSEMLKRQCESFLITKISSIDDIKPSTKLDIVNEWLRILSEYDKIGRGPSKNIELINVFKTKILSSFSDLIGDMYNAYYENDNKLKMFLSDLQQSEKKWKAMLEQTEKLLNEKNVEKDEMLATNNELSIKVDQLVRELKSKESEIKAVSDIHNYEKVSYKQMTDSFTKEKKMVIDDLNAVH